MREQSKSGATPRSARLRGLALPKRWNREQTQGQAQAQGFTFIEMVIVIVMLGILLGIAVPVYQAQIRSSKESVLKHNLAVIRERLDQFRADRNKYPASLTELVDNGYLREIPEDPMTSSNEWEEIYGDYDPNEPDADPGIEDVRSRSTEMGVDGRPYSEW